jgi:hypothetical protein
VIDKRLCNIILGNEFDTIEDYNQHQILNDSNCITISDFCLRGKKFAFNEGYTLLSGVSKKSGICYFDKNGIQLEEMGIFNASDENSATIKALNEVIKLIERESK